MEQGNNKTSLRSLAKALGISHSTLSKIANGSYPANTGNIFKKVISTIDGVLIPKDKYNAILEMLKDASFPKFSETSLTAAWLYNTIQEANKKESKNASANK
jgi:transcriptional regulator with XRE-family HTH domain